MAGATIRKILHSRLPQRFADRVPPPVLELAVGLALAFIAFLIRANLTPILGGVAPYATVFIATALASVIGGWRSGLVCMLAGQMLVSVYILEPAGAFSLSDVQQRSTFIVATISQLILLLIIGVYQHEVDKGVAERERRLDLLDKALNEIDHRTRNNYQTVLALVHLQAQGAAEPKVKEALQQVTDRIQAIAAASERLALKSGDLGQIRLDEHLTELCDQIGRGLSREEIRVTCEVESVTANADAATSISIIVNELVTNAIKHAFNGEQSGSVNVTGKGGRAFELTVADDGRGIAAVRKSKRVGLGTKLVESFVQQLDAQHEVISSENGTIHRLVIPNLE